MAASNNFLAKLERNPAFFKRFFTQQEVDGDAVLSKIEFQRGDEDDDRLRDLVERYINESSQVKLESMLLFLTGATTIPVRSIKVKLGRDEEDLQGINSSTCTFKLIIPMTILASQNFNVYLDAVIHGKTFTVV